MRTVNAINELISSLEKEGMPVHYISDGYHTFDELYEFRMMYNAALFNEWAAQGKYDVHKSLLHHDGNRCFDGGWFIVVAMLPTGMISNHYELQHWRLFNIPETDKAKYPFDGHTPNDVLARIKQLIMGGKNDKVASSDSIL